MNGTRIFIVEDETVVALDMRRTLQRMGYVVCGISSTGEDAIQQLRTANADIVFMDIMLEGEMNGIAAAQIVKDRYGIPVIFSSAFSDDQIIQLAKTTEPFGYIHKPFQEKELRVNVEMAIYKHTAECRLRESERRFRLLYENMPISYQTLDKNGKIQDANDIWLSLIGHERLEVIGCPFDKFLSEQSRGRFNFLSGLPAIKNELSGIDLEVVQKNGHIINVKLDGKIIHDEAGDIRSIHCVIRDVTEKKKQDEIQSLTLEILRLLNRSNNGNDLIRTILHKIKSVSNLEAAAIRILNDSEHPYFATIGFTDDFLNSECHIYCNRKTGQDCFCGAVLAGTGENDCHYLTQNGSFWTNRLSAFSYDKIKKMNSKERRIGECCIREGYESTAIIPIRSDDTMIGLLQLSDKHPDRLSPETIEIFEKLACSIGIAVARSTCEEKILMLKEHVENLNNAMSSEMDNQKKIVSELETARKQVETANRAKVIFLENMSNEINKPVTEIVGFASLLNDTEMSEQQQAYLDNIQSSSESLLTLVNDIIDLTKIDSGTLVLKEIDFNLRNTVSNVIDMVLFAARERGLNIATLINASVPLNLRGDPGRIRQVLLNLVNNAIKFTPKGEIVISVETVKIIDDGVILHFAIKDTGIGISKEDQSRLFTTFAQLGSSSARKHGGVGLGLAISRKIVELMGGEIGLESKEGEGSTFWFEITLRNPLQKQDISCEINDLKNLSVLVVDKNYKRLKSRVALLQSWKCCTYEAGNIDTAVDLLKENGKSNINVKIVLIETGAISTELINKAGRLLTILPCPNLLLITSIGNRGDAELVCSKGFSAYLTKPLLDKDLFDCLSMLKSKSSAPVASANQNLLTRHSIQDERKIGIRILLAEDNVMIQTLTAIILRRAGYICDIVNNGCECVSAIKKGHYDLILMDCQMPEMNGFEAAHKIRALNSSRVPIIALTASETKSDREACLASGMDDILVKPVDQEHLVSKIEYWINANTGAVTECKSEENQKPGCEIPNIDELLQVLRIDRESMEVILKQFFNKLSNHLEIIERAFRENDTSIAKMEIHSLKGASANICLRRAVYLLSELEESLMIKDQKRIDVLYGTVKKYLITVSQKLSIHQTDNDKETVNNAIIPEVPGEKSKLLQKLFEKGDLIGIAEAARSWSVAEEPFKYFYNRIETLAKDFKEKELDMLIKRLIKSES